MNEYFNLNDRRIDTAKVISVGLNILLLFTTGLFAWLYFAKPCPPCTDGDIVRIQRDTAWSYTALKPITVKVPEAYRTEKVTRGNGQGSKKQAQAAVVSALPLLKDYFAFEEDSTEPAMVNGPLSMVDSPCDFVNFYADTLFTKLGDKQVPQAAIYYQVQGTLLSREIWQADVQTQVRETQQVLHRERWKLYVGVAAKISNSLKGWGVGPTGSLAIPKVGLVQYGYDVRNHDHLIGFSALIRFKK